MYHRTTNKPSDATDESDEGTRDSESTSRLSGSRAGKRSTEGFGSRTNSFDEGEAGDRRAPGWIPGPLIRSPSGEMHDTATRASESLFGQGLGHRDGEVEILRVAPAVTTATTTTTTTATTTTTTTTVTARRTLERFDDVPLYSRPTTTDAEAARTAGRVLKQEYAGNCVFAFSQLRQLDRLPLRLRFGPLNGVCYALSIDWLARKLRGRRNLDDAHYEKPGKRLSSMWKLARDHTRAIKIRREKPGPRGETEAFEHLGKKARGGELARANAVDFSNPLDATPRCVATGLCDALRERGDRSAMMISMGQIDGHAIALHCAPDGSFHVFDPNLGEYRFDSAESAACFVVDLWDWIYRRPMGYHNFEAHWLFDRPARGRDRK